MGLQLLLGRASPGVVEGWEEAFFLLLLLGGPFLGQGCFQGRGFGLAATCFTLGPCNGVPWGVISQPVPVDGPPSGFTANVPPRAI